MPRARVEEGKWAKAGVIVAVASVVVGAYFGYASLHHSSGPGPSSRPTLSVSGSASSSPLASGASGSGASNGTPAPGSSGSASAAVGGTLLGSYYIHLASGSTVSLGPTQPPSSAFSSDGNGDLEKVYSRLELPANSGDLLAALPDGATPTYQECSADTDSPGMIIPYVGTSFCLTETSGLIAGGEVTAISSGDFANNVLTIRIFIWRHVG
jgi:hypothetical protein